MSFRLIFKASTLLVTVALIGFLPAILYAESPIVELNLTYGKGGTDDLKLDLAYPKGNSSCPAIVFIHGGAWAGGSRADYRSKIEQAASKGFVAAAIDYRLTGVDLKTREGKTPFPAQVQDCKCAVRWLRSVAGRYHIDPNRIGVTGGSAGGHLSLLLGLTESVKEFEGNGGHSDQLSSVQTVVNFCGPTELTQEYKDVEAVRPFLEALCVGTPTTAADAYKQASPINYVDSKCPPILTFHGDQDEIVPVLQAKLFDTAMQKANARHQLIIFKDQGHAIGGDAGRIADKAMWEFFEKHLKR